VAPSRGLPVDSWRCHRYDEHYFFFLVAFLAAFFFVAMRLLTSSRAGIGRQHRCQDGDPALLSPAILPPSPALPAALFCAQNPIASRLRC
jgi:hypothetical protein